MNKVPLVFVLLLFTSVPSKPQTAADLSSKYPVVSSYEVRPGILVIPSYASDRQVCELWIQKQNATRSGIRLDNYMSDELIKEIVDELVPPSVRGKSSRGEEWDGVDLIVGVVWIVSYQYENLTITVSQRTENPRQGPRILVITWKNRACKDEGKPLPLDHYPK